MNIQKLKVTATSTFGNDYVAAEGFMTLMKEAGVFFDARCRNFINCSGYDKWSEYLPNDKCNIGGFRMTLNAPDSRFSVQRFLQTVYENQLATFMRLHGFENKEGDEHFFHTFSDKYGIGSAAKEVGLHMNVNGTAGYIALIGEDSGGSDLQITLSIKPINKPGLFEMVFGLCYDYAHRII